MLKAKKSKSTKQMEDAIKEVTKEDLVQFHCHIPSRVMWKLRAYLGTEAKKRRARYTLRSWLIERIESLPDSSDK